MVHSAGLLLYRRQGQSVEVFLVHPGGPFWKNKDQHAWSIPKGEFDPAAEDPLDAARREFTEETGQPAPTADPLPLEPVKATNKIIHAFALEAELDPGAIRSNTFTIDWPPRSGRKQQFPEIDRANWFPLDEAQKKLHKSHLPLLTQLATLLTAKP